MSRSRRCLNPLALSGGSGLRRRTFNSTDICGRALQPACCQEGCGPQEPRCAAVDDVGACGILTPTLMVKEPELTAEERRLGNFIDFIADGRGSLALADTLSVTEKKVEAPKEELTGLRASGERVCQAPPIEWIEERVAGLKEVLERRTETSALLLRKLLGEIRLEPKAGTETGRPYYLARTSLDALEILEPPSGGPEGGSKAL